MKVYQVTGSLCEKFGWCGCGDSECSSIVLFETHDKNHYNTMVKSVKRISKSLGYTKMSETTVNRHNPKNGYGIYHVEPNIQREIFKEMNYTF